MRIKLSQTLVAVSLICLLAFLTLGESHYTSYCTRCGLIRGDHLRVCLGITSRSRAEYYETEFRRLYQRFVSKECNHLWQGFSQNHHRRRQGEVGLPMLLRDYYGYDNSYLSRLTHLGDRSRISTVLTSCNLADSFPAAVNSEVRMMQSMPILWALEKLEAVSSRPEAEQWWSENQHLFVSTSTAR